MSGKTSKSNGTQGSGDNIAYSLSIIATFSAAIGFTWLVFYFLSIYKWFIEEDIRIMAVGFVFMAVATVFPGLAVHLLSSSAAAPSLSFVEKGLATLMIFTSMTAMADTLITLHMIGITELGSFYLTKGEPYFNSLYGLLCLGNDGFIHLGLQVTIGYLIMTGKTYKYIALFYAGSVFNSMFPLLLGAAGAGEHSSHVKPSTALNAPWLLIPFGITVISFFALKKGSKQAKASKDTSKNASDPHKVQTNYLLDHLFLVFHIGALVVHTFRALAVINSKAPAVLGYVKNYEPLLSPDEDPTTKGVVMIQVLQSFFYLLPVECFLIFETIYRSATGKRSDAVLNKGGDSQAPFDSIATNVSAFFAGGLFQAQLCISLGMGVLNYKKGYYPLLDNDYLSNPNFLSVNVLLLLVPIFHHLYLLQVDEKH